MKTCPEIPLKEISGSPSGPVTLRLEFPVGADVIESFSLRARHTMVSLVEGATPQDAYLVFACTLGDIGLHCAMTPEVARAFANTLSQGADLIDSRKG